MAPTLRPSHLHGRVCGQNLSVSIQNHDRRAHRQNVEYSANSSRVKGAGRALHRSVLAELLVCRALAAAEPIVGSWAQGLQRGSAKYEHVVQSFAEVLQERLVPVLLHNVLAAWLSMVVSGVAALQLPIRYAVTSSSQARHHRLVCCPGLHVPRPTDPAHRWLSWCTQGCKACRPAGATVPAHVHQVTAPRVM